MKTSSFVFLAVVALMLGLAGKVNAQGACGGTVEYSNDCAGNDRKWHISCCPDGYRVQGVAYTDIKDRDAIDAISTICRKVGAMDNPPQITGDFQKAPKKFECNKEEVMAGIRSKDRAADDNKSDTLDSIEVACQNPKGKNLRWVYNTDAMNNGRAPREQTVLLPARIVGIASKEKEKGTSDEKDCVTVVTKR
ncbi:MAG: hypothetical protein HY541_00540 [Deltaproteobacteria bacterium]|nr:hypothetical protein [Deltaproteobacteria bacterium]